MSKVAELSNHVERKPLVEQDARVTETDTILKFVILSAIHLLIGTVQGVMQTFPGVAQWLREAGPAGHLIDPLGHSLVHILEFGCSTHPTITKILYIVGVLYTGGFRLLSFFSHLFGIVIGCNLYLHPFVHGLPRC